MYRVLIVEDEMLVRLGMKNSIDWNRFNMTVIADAADGQAAWDIYQTEIPDIVITDLKMPVMDGIELITRIREKDKSTLIIILSCIEEFDIARKAIPLGVFDYILKLTMTEEEMEKVLKKAQDQLDKNGNMLQIKHTESNHIVIKEKFLKEFLFYNIHSARELEAFAAQESLRLNPGRMVVCVLEIDHYKNLQASFNDDKGDLVKSALLNIVSEILDNHGRGEAFSDCESRYILILSFSDVASEQNIHKELHAILNNIKSTINSYLNVYVSFGISSMNSGYRCLGSMYREAVTALERKFFSGTGIFHSSNHSDFDNIVVEKLNSLKQLPGLLKIAGITGKNDFDKRMTNFIDNFPKNSEQIKLFFAQMLQWSVTLPSSINDNYTAIIMKYTDRIQKSETLDEIIEIFKVFISDLTGEIMKKKVLSREIAKALEYIRLNYCNDINLPQVAEYVKLSPNYLGNLFKKELQVSFIEYLSELRISKAKDLLLGTYLKSYEVAEKVGFTENTYFCKVFKRVAGLSPNEFRRQLMKEWSDEMDNENNKIN